MNLCDAIHGRRAVRSFTAQPVERVTIEALIEAATHAPSAMNEQPWDFCVIDDTLRLEKISQQAAAYALASPPQHLGELHPASFDKPHFNLFYHAPVLVVISAREGRWVRENAALAAQNFMLEAHACGLGACWIGIAQRWLETEPGKAAIECPEGYLPVAPIIVGYPASQGTQASRRAPRIRWLL